MLQVIPDPSTAREILIRVAPRMLMRIDPAYEKLRVDFMKPLLTKYAKEFLSRGVMFPHDLYLEGTPGQCYHNAGELATKEGLTYCEGVMIVRDPEYGVQAMPHAWCCDDRGQVIDPSAAKAQHLDHVTYVGIAFKTDYVARWKSTYGFYGLLDGHPVLGKTVGVYADPEPLWLKEVDRGWPGK